MKGNVTLIDCPKLDSVDYSQKMTESFKKKPWCGADFNLTQNFPDSMINEEQFFS